jgi:hypothetical protein
VVEHRRHDHDLVRADALGEGGKAVADPFRVADEQAAAVGAA